jgi:hypothetical protein
LKQLMNKMPSELKRSYYMSLQKRITHWDTYMHIRIHLDTLRHKYMYICTLRTVRCPDEQMHQNNVVRNKCGEMVDAHATAITQGFWTQTHYNI